MPFHAPPPIVQMQQVRYSADTVDTDDAIATVEFVTEHYTMFTAGDGQLDFEVRPHVPDPVFRLAREALDEFRSTDLYREIQHKRASRRLAERTLPGIELRFEALVARWINRA